MSDAPQVAPKIMLGFIVRQCAVAIGHRPTAKELVEWANNQGRGRQRYCIFGRPITLEEARVILRHPGRPVTHAIRPGAGAARVRIASTD